MRVYYDFVPAPEIASDRIKGLAVYSPAGERIGRVRRLLIDKVSGRASSVQVTAGGFMGFGGRQHTIAWEELAYDSELDGYRAVISQRQVNVPSSQGLPAPAHAPKPSWA
jgi:sporulation protein YlmC with PRC-barrel domain